MNIIAVGCEYTGTTTLMNRLQEWIVDAFGQTTIVHDHFKLPHVSGHPPIDPDSIILTDTEKRQVLDMTPKVKELFTRYTLYYHTPSHRSESTVLGGLHIGHHIDELIYAPMYFGYGGPGEPGDRRAEAQRVEQNLMKYTPEAVLVLVRASANAVRARMEAEPRPEGILRTEDVEHVLQRFDEEFTRSAIRNKIMLDTTHSTPDETFREFLEEMEPLWTEGDRLRMLTRAL